MVTAASTSLAKSARFTEHVSPGYCGGIAFHTIFDVYSWLIVLMRSLLTVQLAVFEIKAVHTDEQTELSTTVTLTAHTREG